MFVVLCCGVLDRVDHVVVWCVRLDLSCCVVVCWIGLVMLGWVGLSVLWCCVRLVVLCCVGLG